MLLSLFSQSLTKSPFSLLSLLQRVPKENVVKLQLAKSKLNSRADAHVQDGQ